MKLESKYAREMFNYCKDKWGISKYQDDYPSLVIHRKNVKEGDKDWDVMGSFNEVDNCIHIYINHHENYPELADTIIHEYTHYLQNIKGMYMKYINYYSYNYYNHPYEKVARRRGRKFKKECLEYICISEK